MNDIEANMFYDIASERVQVIMEFQSKMDANDKEQLLQKYLFDNLWILNPSWERPTAGSEIMEKNVQAEFQKVTHTLSPDEQKGRMDIKYRTAAGKHIIIELKRYNPTYKITPNDLYLQLRKYKRGLEKCIETNTNANQPIETIAILGSKFNSEQNEELEGLLKLINGRVIYYDQLIEESLTSYKDFLDKQKEISRLRKIIDEIIN